VKGFLGARLESHVSAFLQENVRRSDIEYFIII
jgi:hypothetical protein